MSAVCLLIALSLYAAPRYSIEEVQQNGVLFIVLKDGTGGLEAAIAPAKGGELSGLRVRHKGQWIETLYLARDYTPRQSWTGKAPFLWPATGRNFPGNVKPNEAAVGSSYDYQGKRYPMPIHGFVRDMVWKEESRLLDDRGARLTLALRDSDETRRMYPFGFELKVTYVVNAGGLSIHYAIGAAASNQEQMMFSAGNHITFNTPLIQGSDPLAMRFTSPSSVEFLKREGGVPTGETRPRSFGAGERLGNIEKKAAVSLGGYKQVATMTLADPAGLSLHMAHEADSYPADPLIRFNVWGDPADGYFSPEPWVGLQNSLVLNQGLVRLAPGGRWNWRIRIRAESQR
jgi:galactose mutarotase-like enzyme